MCVGGGGGGRILCTERETFIYIEWEGGILCIQTNTERGVHKMWGGGYTMYTERERERERHTYTQSGVGGRGILFIQRERERERERENQCT